MRDSECAAKKSRDDQRARKSGGLPAVPVLNHQNIAGVLVANPGTSFPTKEPSGPHILQKSSLAAPDSPSGAGLFFPPDVSNQGISAGIPNTIQDYSYFDRSAIIEPGRKQTDNLRSQRPKVMSQTGTDSNPNNSSKVPRLSKSGILSTLLLVREPVVNYQESRGVSRNEEVTFLALVTSLCSQSYTAGITILVMLWNLMPLVDGLVYFVRFCLDKLIDIVQADNNKDRAIKAAIFFGELTVVIFLIFMMVGLIFMPVYMLVSKLIVKIISMVA